MVGSPSMSDEDCGKGLIVSVSDDYGRVSVRHIAEQVGDRLAIVGAAHCLRKHHAYINASDLVTVFHCEILGNGIGDNYRFEAGIVDSLQGRPGKDSMSEDSVDLRCSRLNELASRETNCAASVGHVVHQNCDSV